MSENQLLTFNSSVAQLTVSVSIVEDNLDEIYLENFNASLVLVTDNDHVIINPEQARVTIEDVDGKVNTLKINNYLHCV